MPLYRQGATMKVWNIGAERARWLKVCTDILKGGVTCCRAGDVAKAKEALADWQWAFAHYKSLFV